MSKRDYLLSAIEEARQFRSKRIKENGPGIPWEGFLEQEEQAVDFLTLPSTHDHAQTNE